MRPHRPGPTFVAIVVLCLLGAAAVSAAVRNPIREMSHRHPPGADYSFVCAHLKGKDGQRAAATIRGPWVVGENRRKITFSRRHDNWFTASWPIKSAGEYVLTLVDRTTGKRIDRRRYRVPSPPPGGAAQGPFECPDRHRPGKRG